MSKEIIIKYLEVEIGGKQSKLKYINNKIYIYIY
jgi:hypothetical protein